MSEQWPQSTELDWVICDGCGADRDCVIVTPTLDGSPAYHICQHCIHAATRAVPPTQRSA